MTIQVESFLNSFGSEQSKLMTSLQNSTNKKDTVTLHRKLRVINAIINYLILYKSYPETD